MTKSVSQSVGLSCTDFLSILKNEMSLLFRRFGTKCSGCSQGIAPSDLVRRARDQVYHVTCFNCVVCGKQLSTGDQLYFLDENQFICKNDYCNSKLTGKIVHLISTIPVFSVVYIIACFTSSLLHLTLISMGPWTHDSRLTQAV